MLTNFLLQNQSEILALTERKTLELAGDHPSSDQLKQGLPIFYGQIIEVIGQAGSSESPPAKDEGAIARAADRRDEPAMAEAAGRPLEADVARAAGAHGLEMRLLGYTLSHVVHAYGAMCQAITETATKKAAAISANEFHAPNRCLDVAIAGAVTHYDSRRASEDSELEGKKDQAAEMRSLLMRAKIAFQAIRKGSVGVSGSTAESLQRCLDRMQELLDPPVVEGDATRRGPSN